MTEQELAEAVNKITWLTQKLAHVVDREIGTENGEASLYFSILYMISKHSHKFMYTQGLEDER